ncbi:MAG TPA: hypothetical protein VE132_03685 [Micromonosporaceae bacterium]|nr:hypothetical protein [Micromonosporaceae bacterium]
MRTRDEPIGRADTMPGDEIVPDAAVVMDRECVLPAPPRDVWPWIVQLGKDRAGWYMPRWVDWVFIPRHRRSLRRIDDRWQTLAPGEHIPDWGPGDPTFEVVSIDPPHALVYQSIRARRPQHGSARPNLVLSWALVLDDLPDGRCRLRIRLRTSQIGRRFPRAAEAMADTVDRLTVALLFAGLRERVR